jgi:hypothetical protein
VCIDRSVYGLLDIEKRLASEWIGKEPPEKTLGWSALEGMHK